ncbi:helix-turn-helix transcriptional regulator [Xenorhabdus sp. XENO-10]|uniref:Helix-turn-helix transcriptional regulator n=2 Tax=Xenorhabdus yunnanensis TaxID=3025878 RepID=A0ABT5LI03_9GAMM|nr:helix-turn-helix transcriptional regulator [Xenorhabdus yunnanensis]
MKKNDWHPADISAAIRKTGISLSELSRQVGLSSSTLQNALHRRYPKGERHIAQHIGVHTSEIWPSRYKGKIRK